MFLLPSALCSSVYAALGCYLIHDAHPVWGGIFFIVSLLVADHKIKPPKT